MDSPGDVLSLSKGPPTRFSDKLLGYISTSVAGARESFERLPTTFVPALRLNSQNDFARREKTANMASIHYTQPIHIEPRPVASERERRRRRHLFLKAVILLTVPFYCVGVALLAMLHVEAMLNRAASSPLFLGGLAFFVFLLLMEPWTGALTHSCVAGVKCASVGAADPVSCLGCLGGCLSVIGVVAGIVALAAWLL